MVFQQSFSHHVISRAALSWLILIALGTQLPASAATSALAHYFPRYQCADNPKAVFCQSFEQNAQGLNFLAEKDAASGLANGSLLLNTERQTLSYKAARTGGHLFTIDPKQLNGLRADNFYYEALIRPYANSTTDRETLYLTLKDAQAERYFAAGFKVGSSVFTSKLELAMLPGAQTQATQVQVLAEQALPVVLGAQDATDGQWYLLRLQRQHDTLSLYLNGQQVAAVTIPAHTVLTPVGIWSFNRSFEMDYLAVGTAKPAELDINLQQLENQPITGYQFEQSQDILWRVDNVDTADISVINLTPELFTLQSDKQQFRLQYLKPGQGAVLLQSQSQPHRFKQLNIQVLPALAFPAKTDSSQITALWPEPASRVSADTLLKLTLAQDFRLSEHGAVRLYQLHADGTTTLVDEIKAGLEMDAFGSSRANKYRSIRRPMIWQDGKTLLIKPHSGKLAAGNTYQVQVSAGLLQFSTDVNTFNGIGPDARWQFSIKAEPQAKPTMRVAQDGSGDFLTVQGALDFVMSDAGAKVQTVKIGAGVYPEPLYLYGTEALLIEGEGANLSHIAFSNYESLNSGLGLGYGKLPGHTGGGRSLFMVEDVGQLILKNLSITNLHQRREGVRNQAESLYFNSTGKLLVGNSHFTSEQDTLMLKGTSYFYRCLIAGNVDFIWGQNYLSLFEQNEIRSLGNSVKDPDSEYAEGSYILQARTVSEDAPGFIFINNRFTSHPGPTGNRIRPGSTFIARSAGRPAYIDNVLLLNNQFDQHISAQGWAGPLNHEPLPNPEQADATRGWREYGSTDLKGNELDTSARSYGRVLTEDELPFSDVASIMRQYWPDFDAELLADKTEKN